MPLFFIIAIGAGAFALGATTVDATSDMRAQRESPTAQVEATGSSRQLIRPRPSARTRHRLGPCRRQSAKGRNIVNIHAS